MGETSRHDEKTVIGAYKLSKVVAERLVDKMVQEKQLPAIIVSPSTPIGPRDIRPTPTGRIIVEAATGKIPAFVDTGLNLVHVDDVAQGHLLALDKGEIGERYILGGKDVTLQQMLAVIADLANRRAPRLKLAARPALSAGLCRTSRCPPDQQGAFHHDRCAEHVEISHVLFLREGRTRIGLSCTPLSRGPGRRDGMVR